MFKQFRYKLFIFKELLLARGGIKRLPLLSFIRTCFFGNNTKIVAYRYLIGSDLMLFVKPNMDAMLFYGEELSDLIGEVGLSKVKLLDGGRNILFDDLTQIKSSTIIELWNKKQESYEQRRDY